MTYELVVLSLSLHLIDRVLVSRRRLHLLISILASESCKDSSFLKINTLTRRISRVEVSGISISVPYSSLQVRQIIHRFYHDNRRRIASISLTSSLRLLKVRK
jgi:hypothetical protein